MESSQLKEQLMNVSLFSFRQSTRIPATSGIYAAWLEGQSRRFYVGMSTNL